MLGLPLIQRLLSEGPASPTIQGPGQEPELPPTVLVRRERTRERRTPILETLPTTQEPRSQTPERAPSLAPPAKPWETLSEPPRETLSVLAVSGVLGILEAITVPTTPNALVVIAVALSEYAPSNVLIDAPINTLRVLPIRYPRSSLIT